MKQLYFLFLLGLTLAGAQVATAASDTSAVYELIDIAREKQQQGIADSAEYYFKQAGELAKQLGFDRGLLMYAGHYCVFLYQQVRYEEALGMARIQLQVGKRLDDKQRISYAYNNLSLQYQALGKMPAAAESLMEALAISSEIKQPTRQHLLDRKKFYNNLSSLLLDMNDLEKGLQYALKGYKIAEALQDTLEMGRCLVNVLVAEAMSNKLDDATRHGLQLLAFGRSQGDVQMELKAYNNLGDIYRMQKRYTHALETFKKAQAILEKAPPGNEVYTLMGLSSTYKDLGQYQEADRYYKKAVALAGEELAKPQLKELLLSGAEIKEALGVYSDALRLRKRYELLSDSLLSQQTHHTIQELEVKYQTAEKEKALAERDLQISEQHSNLERKNKWFLLTVSLAAILILVLLFGRLISLQKRKAEASEQAIRILEAQLKGEEQERARTALELHDGVASILSAAKLHIHARNRQEQGSNTMLSQLIETAVQEIRDISHNLAPETVLHEGFEHAVQEFCRRVNHGGLQLECYVIGELPKLDTGTALLLYRVIQEAVANIVKHADAAEALVQLVGEGKRLSITIEDNGKGFNPEMPKEKGIGLKNLSSRIQLLKGNYEFNSAPGKGTSIYIEIDTGSYRPSTNIGMGSKYTG